MADHCNNTPGLPGQSPSVPSTSVRSLDDIHRDAIFLHAFAQGVAELYDQVEATPTPVTNSMPAMFESLIERADRLAGEIEAYEYAERHK